MAISDSYDWNLTRTEIISNALRIAGALGEWENASSTRLSRMVPMLQSIVKMKGQIGMPLWKTQTLILPVSSFNSNGVVSIGEFPATFSGPKPMKVLSAWIVDKNSPTTRRRELEVISRKEHLRQNVSAAAGTVHSLYFQPLRVHTEFWLSNAPDTYSIDNDDVEIHYQAQISDVDSDSDNVDFPSEWLLLITYELASVAAAMYGTPTTERSMIEAKLKELRKMAEEFDVEEGSLIVSPNYDG